MALPPKMPSPSAVSNGAGREGDLRQRGYMLAPVENAPVPSERERERGDGEEGGPGRLEATPKIDPPVLVEMTWMLTVCWRAHAPHHQL